MPYLHGRLQVDVQGAIELGHRFVRNFPGEFDPLFQGQAADEPLQGLLLRTGACNPEAGAAGLARQMGERPDRHFDALDGQQMARDAQRGSISPGSSRGGTSPFGGEMGGVDSPENRTQEAGRNALSPEAGDRIGAVAQDAVAATKALENGFGAPGLVQAPQPRPQGRWIGRGQPPEKKAQGKAWPIPGGVGVIAGGADENGRESGEPGAGKRSEAGVHEQDAVRVKLQRGFANRP